MTIAGVEPRAVVEPHSVDEVAATLRELYAAERPFAVVGGGGDLELGNAPRALDTVVMTTACNRTVEYAPEDQTITVEAGMTLGDVTDVLAAHGQFLAIDVADPERTTVGGAIAANLFGRRRLRYGGIKDNIVGVEIVRPDGTRARGGGKVVKNVAGFDIPKLMVGSLGTLGAIASATFRVHPVEPRRGAVLFREAGAAQVMRLCDAMVAASLVPDSVVAYDAARGYDLVAAFAGFAGGVDEQTETAAGIARRLGVAFESAVDLTPYDTKERAARRDDGWRVTIGAAPLLLGRWLESAPLAPAHVVWYPLLGSAFASAPELAPATVAGWRSALRGGTAVVSAMPPAMRAQVDAWGEPPPSWPIARRLKERFDPKGLCNAGRFIGGL